MEMRSQARFCYNSLELGGAWWRQSFLVPVLSSPVPVSPPTAAAVAPGIFWDILGHSACHQGKRECWDSSPTNTLMHDADELGHHFVILSTLLLFAHVQHLLEFRPCFSWSARFSFVLWDPQGPNLPKFLSCLTFLLALLKWIKKMIFYSSAKLFWQAVLIAHCKA